jgi:tRNA(fMet)-specific endonuclease VapC
VRILDTDVCVELLRGNPRVLERRATIREEVATTWITVGELHHGAAKSAYPDHNRAAVVGLVATMPVLDLDELAARVFGEAKALLEKRGTRLADADLLVGAVAVAHRAIVVTGNTRHLGRIPGVITEDWLRG